MKRVKVPAGCYLGRKVRSALGSRVRILPTIFSAGAPEYSRQADLQADAFSIAGLFGTADKSAAAAFVTAPIFVGTLGIRIAGRSGCEAVVELSRCAASLLLPHIGPGRCNAVSSVRFTTITVHEKHPSFTY